MVFLLNIKGLFKFGFGTFRMCRFESGSYNKV